MNFDPGMMKNLMKQLKMEDVKATEVIIKSPDGDITISNPSVQRMNVQGKEMFQISGDVKQDETVEVSEEDVNVVRQQTGATDDEALEALGESNGDIAGAILLLKQKKK